MLIQQKLFKKRRRKKGQHRLTKRQCVISTGYKSYFLAILINVKLFDEEHHGWTGFPSLTQAGLLSHLPDLGHFYVQFSVYLFCVFMQSHVRWKNALFKSQPLKRLSTKMWAEDLAAGSERAVKQQMSVHCILCLILKCINILYLLLASAGSKIDSKQQNQGQSQKIITIWDLKKICGFTNLLRFYCTYEQWIFFVHWYRLCIWLFYFLFSAICPKSRQMAAPHVNAELFC